MTSEAAPPSLAHSKGREGVQLPGCPPPTSPLHITIPSAPPIPALSKEEAEQDQKLCVKDPATKQRLLIPFHLTENTSGRIEYYCQLSKAQRRESQICMLYQKGKCNSGIRCNQIHACRSYVAEMRKATGKEVKSDEPLTNQRAREVIVRDPTNEDSKIVIPFNKTEETKGRQRFFSSQKQGSGDEPEIFVLCSSFMHVGSCERGVECDDIHGNKEFVRYLLEGPKPCCPDHGDMASSFSTRNKILMVNKLSRRCPVPIARIAVTRGLKELVKPSFTLIFCCNRVCRLHQEKRCVHGMNCSNIHVCREFYALFSNAPNPGKVRLPAAIQKPPNAPDLPPPSETVVPDKPQQVVGTPLPPKEVFGIPIVTESGPVPVELLPADYLPYLVNTPVRGVPMSGGMAIGTPCPDSTSVYTAEPPSTSAPMVQYGRPPSSSIPYASSEPSNTPPTSPTRGEPAPPPFPVAGKPLQPPPHSLPPESSVNYSSYLPSTSITVGKDCLPQTWSMVSREVAQKVGAAMGGPKDHFFKRDHLKELNETELGPQLSFIDPTAVVSSQLRSYPSNAAPVTSFT